METSTRESNFSFRSHVLEAIALTHNVYKVIEQAFYELDDLPEVITNLRVYEKIFVYPKNQDLFRREFVRFYDKHTGEILASLHNDAWLRQGFSVNAVRDLNDPKITKKISKVAIFDLGQIYCRFLEYEEENKILYEGKKDKPSLQFLTIVLKIFSDIVGDPEEKNELEMIIKALEQRRGTYCPPATASSGSFANIARLIQRTMTQAGFPIADTAIPSEEVFSNTIDRLVNNDLTKTVLSKVFDTMKDGIANPEGTNTEQIGSTLTKLIQDFVAPEVTSSVEALAETLETESSSSSSSSGQEEMIV